MGGGANRDGQPRLQELWSSAPQFWRVRTAIAQMHTLVIHNILNYHF